MNFHVLNKYRFKRGPWGTDFDCDYGLFFIPVKKSNIPLKVISSGKNNGDWYHVSVSLPNRCPTWEEMCLVKDLFFGDEVVIQFHPKKENYVNNHPFCLHLWRNLKSEIITPPTDLVGIK